MSDVVAETAETQEVPAAPGRTAGQILREAREASGLHIAVLALALKVPVKKIEALEADRHDELLDPVFLRALASSVCRHLKLDTASILALLPQTSKPTLQLDGPIINTPFQTPSELAREPIWNQVSKPALLIALVLLVGALVVILFPSTDAVSVASKSEDEHAASPAAAAPATPEVVNPPAQVVETVAVNPAGAVPVATGTALNTGLPIVQGKADTKGAVVFTTRAPSWVEVTDATGVVQIRRTINVGEVVGVSGPQPLNVVVGRADMMDVQVMGKPFALAPVTRDNVARFEVK